VAWLRGYWATSRSRKHEQRAETGGHRASWPGSPSRTMIVWVYKGEANVVEVNGVRIVVRFVGRRGRRGRIAIEAAPGAVFRGMKHRAM